MDTTATPAADDEWLQRLNALNALPRGTPPLLQVLGEAMKRLLAGGAATMPVDATTLHRVLGLKRVKEVATDRIGQDLETLVEAVRCDDDFNGIVHLVMERHAVYRNAIEALSPSSECADYLLRGLHTLYACLLYPALAPMLERFLKTSLASVDADAMHTDEGTELSLFRRLCMELDIAVDVEDLVPTIMQERLLDLLEDECSASFDTSAVELLDSWMLACKAWLELATGTAGAEKHSHLLQCDAARIVYEFRCKQLFDIIVDYPDSMPALEDIKHCLSRGKFDRRFLISMINSSMSTRLLQPAAKTGDIVDQYISTIRCLIYLDSTGLVLQSVANPIRAYLRKRKDTVRCIINKFFVVAADSDLEDTHNLADELRRAEQIVIEGNDVLEDYLDPNWMPVPSDIGKNLVIRKNAGDILSSLVNIYDSVDVFVKEFQRLLSARLLSIYDYDNQRELAQLEMLKCRFGEASVQACEIMVKDMDDSRRLDALIHERLNVASGKSIAVHSTIISRLFWPNVSSASFTMPVAVQEQLEAYEKQFAQLKRSRHLSYYSDVGGVDLELQIPGSKEIKQFTVSPIQATIIMLFESRDVCSVASMAKQLKVPEATVRSRIHFWVQQGVLEAVDAYSYALVTESRDKHEEVDHEHHHDDVASGHNGDDSAGQSPMETYWTFIVGMLTNLGSLPADRIHQMLSMFVQAPQKYDCTAEQLKAYLDQLVRADKLEVAGNQYRLNKKASQ